MNSWRDLLVVFSKLLRCVVTFQIVLDSNDEVLQWKFQWKSIKSLQSFETLLETYRERFENLEALIEKISSIQTYVPSSFNF